jgi:hypothetical protein
MAGMNSESADALAKVKASLPKGTPVEIWFQDKARIGQSEADEKTVRGTVFPPSQDHAALGQARYAAFGPEGSRHQVVTCPPLIPRS